jgi:2-succinyl-5-enolpyruvyl-6-hydroxy-3-cyclohexene-1-carboxylate synthase
MGGMTSATDLARKITRDLVHRGIANVVLSPGSRNAPLSIALYQAEQKGLLTLHIRIDERTAAFFALGIAKATHRPVALLCTSGTAPANYHPAIMEARHSMVPLLAITADRPARLRETGANQTTLQAGIFGSAVVASADVSEVNEDLSQLFDSLSSGPAHLNVQFDEPLLSDDKADWLTDLSSIFSTNTVESKEESRQNFEVTESKGVLVIGHDHGGIEPAEISAFASTLGWPVISEDPLSFPEAIAHSALFLASEKIRTELRPEVVVVIGRSTLSRSTNALVKSAAREVVIDPKIAIVDRKRVASEIFTSLPTLSRNQEISTNWSHEWIRYSNLTAAALEALPAWCEPVIAQKVSEFLQDGTTLYIASSRPVRDIEAFAHPRAGVEVFANRGLAGIDGNISTALGIASQRKKTIAILGDLSFLHDLTGIIGAEKIDLRILVINNDGGGIFSTLPQANVEGFEEIFGTPHGKDPAAIAQAMGIPAVTVEGMTDLLEKLSLPIRGLSVVVANVPSRDENAKLIKAIYSKIENS